MAGVYGCSNVCPEASFLLICYKNYFCSMKYVKAMHCSMGRFFKTPPQLSPNPSSAIDRNGDQAGELVKHEIIPSSQREFFCCIKMSRSRHNTV